MKLIKLIFVVLVFAACDDTRVFEQNRDIDNKLWRADSALTFTFYLEDADRDYNLYFTVRNTSSYPFENLYITYNLSDTLNNKLSGELKSFNLFDPKTGVPYGDGLGDIFDHRLLLMENYKFNEPGRYKFVIQQYMRMDSLPEIISAGIRVEYANPNNE